MKEKHSVGRPAKQAHLVQKQYSRKKQKTKETKKLCGIETEKFIHVISNILSELTRKNDQLPIRPEHMTVFDSVKTPSLSIKSYMMRVVQYANCSPECYIFALVYLDRIIQFNEHFYVTSNNIHRLLITSIMIAAKFFDDVYNSNQYYSAIGGVSCKELNRLELEFLYLINFALHIKPVVFEQYRTELKLLAQQL